MVRNFKSLAMVLTAALALGTTPALAGPAHPGTAPSAATSDADHSVQPIWYGYGCGYWGCPRPHYHGWRQPPAYNYYGYYGAPAYGYWRRPAPYYYNASPYGGYWNGGVRVHTPGVDVRIGW